MTVNGALPGRLSHFRLVIDEGRAINW